MKRRRFLNMVGFGAAAAGGLLTGSFITGGCEAPEDDVPEYGASGWIAKIWAKEVWKSRNQQLVYADLVNAQIPFHRWHRHNKPHQLGEFIHIPKIGTSRKITL